MTLSNNIKFDIMRSIFEVVDGKIMEIAGISAKTYRSLKELRADLSNAFKSINVRFADLETSVISAHKKLDHLGRSVSEIQLGQEMLRLDVRRTELATIYGQDINRLYVLKERYDRLVHDLHQAEKAGNDT